MNIDFLLADMLRAANDLLYALEDILESSQFDKMDEMRSSKSSSQGLLSGIYLTQGVEEHIYICSSTQCYPIVLHTPFLESLISNLLSS